MGDRKNTYFENFDQLALAIAEQINDLEFSEGLFMVLATARSELEDSSEDDPNFEKILYRVAYEINKVSSIVFREGELRQKEEEVVKKINSILDDLTKTIDNQNDVDALFLKLKAARADLLNAKSSKEVVLQEAEFVIKSVENQVSLCKQLKDEDSALRILVPVIIGIYIIAIVAIILFTDKSVWNSMSLIPLVEVPISVLLWAALGSMAAILYRFYTKQFEKIGIEIKWLIARPIVGIIMGSLGYIAIVSGLLIFQAESDINPSNIHLYCIVSFLGGFSDKFFEAIIKSLTGKFTSGSSD